MLRLKCRLKERRKNRMSKKKSTAIAFVLMLTIAATLMTCLPAANAVAYPPRDTGCGIAVAPRLSGLGQELTVAGWVWPAPSGPTLYAQDRAYVATGCE